MGQLFTAILLGVAAAGGTAMAQDGPPRGPERMMRADTNGDGAISRAEYQAEVDARFARRDANGNGRIDEGEGMRGRGMRGDAPPPPAPLPAPTGATPQSEATPSPPPFGVGTTREQFQALALTQFERIDTNRDGKIDAAEMRAEMPRRGMRPAPSPMP